jgi:hypothetical protein
VDSSAVAKASLQDHIPCPQRRHAQEVQCEIRDAVPVDITPQDAIPSRCGKANLSGTTARKRRSPDERQAHCRQVDIVDAAGEIRDRVAASAQSDFCSARKYEYVAVLASGQTVPAGAADKHIVSSTADQNVITGASKQAVVAAAAGQRVITPLSSTAKLLSD